MSYTRLDWVLLEISRLPELSEDDADKIMRAVLSKMEKEHFVDSYVPRLKHDAPEPEWMRI